ncbi:hypothetical protein F2Q68_00008995 [Brassica cretica]|uniref:Uncharacterized protein n=1 Tax=Brassica cretica TaxID=69181 RepID=A0A8S9L287_BRACR|nr:hypothetical protein F2Q68_00008995 [Brassica cretica]
MNPRKFRGTPFLGIFRGSRSLEFSEGAVPWNFPSSELPRIGPSESPSKYPEEVLPRYIPRSFPTNWWSSEFPQKLVSSEFRRKIPRDFRGKMNFRGVISENLFHDDFFPQLAVVRRFGCRSASILGSSNLKKGGKLIGVDMSTLIQGSIASHRLNSFENLLREGGVYELSVFDVARSNNHFNVCVRFTEHTKFCRVEESHDLHFN